MGKISRALMTGLEPCYFWLTLMALKTKDKVEIIWFLVSRSGKKQTLMTFLTHVGSKQGWGFILIKPAEEI